jgi:class 3 adenylate cyclase
VGSDIANQVANQIANQAGPASFLFSDIESSTRRWENDPDGMAADLAPHDRLLRDAVESVGARCSVTRATG